MDEREKAEYELLTEPEKVVNNWLTKWKLPFRREVSFFGGRIELGGTYVDFLLDEQRIALRVQGVYWHTGVIPQASDIIRRERLDAQGYTVVDIWESSIVDVTQSQVDYVMRLAIEGTEIPR